MEGDKLNSEQDKSIGKNFNNNQNLTIKLNCQEDDSLSFNRSNNLSKSNVSLCNPNQSSALSTSSLLNRIFDNFGNGRNRSISESEVDQVRDSSTRVNVDLTPWLMHGNNAYTLQVCCFSYWC